MTYLQQRITLTTTNSTLFHASPLLITSPTLESS